MSHIKIVKPVEVDFTVIAVCGVCGRKVHAEFEYGGDTIVVRCNPCGSCEEIEPDHDGEMHERQLIAAGVYDDKV
jgi:hypothetical protein